MAKLSATLLRRVGSGGSTLPGRLATTVAPRLLGEVFAATPTILVAGTNGKTTTTRCVAHALAGRFPAVVSNASGANLFPGIVAAAAAATPLRGPRADVAVFEVDELTLPRVARDVRPAMVVLTNVYRDQLDRYGEIERVMQAFRETIAALPANAILVANADDPRIVAVAREATVRVVWFGVDWNGTPRNVFLLDRELCPHCSDLLAYADDGTFACGPCGFASPRTAFRARVASTADGLAVTIEGRAFSAPLRGEVNAANVAAAYAAARAFGISSSEIAARFESLVAPRGRHERLMVGGRAATLILLKNPVGFNAFLSTLRLDGPTTLVVAINDLAADGEDLSWIWDVEFERLAELPVDVVVSGRRHADVVMRLKYAGVRASKVIDDLDGLVAWLASEPSDARCFVLCTYTAMMRVRELCAARGFAAGYWAQ